jgi:hypothetical protein
MKNDTRVLELLYESTKACDYDFLLLENVDTFDWQKFWNTYYICLQNDYPLYESFEKVQSNDSTDVYDVEARNGQKFQLYVNLLDKNKTKPILLKTIIANLSKKEILKDLQSVFNTTEKPILNVNFKDEQGNITTTQKVGIYAFSVINSINDAIVNTLSGKNQDYPDVIFFYILKSEQRKLEFFKKAVPTIFPKLKNVFVDENSDSNYNLIYFYV